jgi:pyridoxamine 5'-phosphate oxidase
MLPDLTAIRTEYLRAGLDERDLDPSPSRQMGKWLKEAIDAGHPEPTAMTLATITAEGDPAARVVLMKGIDADGIVFFTNYDSDKGRDLAAHPRACANVFWVLLQRQMRVTGAVVKVSREETEAYFRSRPRESQLGAWASNQSGVIEGRAVLDAQLAATRARFGDGEVVCPPHWGGYRLSLERVELWQGRANRLHDRLRYTRDAAQPDHWKIERLAP